MHNTEKLFINFEDLPRFHYLLDSNQKKKEMELKTKKIYAYKRVNRMLIFVVGLKNFLME